MFTLPFKITYTCLAATNQLYVSFTKPVHLSWTYFEPGANELREQYMKLNLNTMEYNVTLQYYPRNEQVKAPHFETPEKHWISRPTLPNGDLRQGPVQARASDNYPAQRFLIRSACKCRSSVFAFLTLFIFFCFVLFFFLFHTRMLWTRYLKTRESQHFQTWINSKGPWVLEPYWFW